MMLSKLDMYAPVRSAREMQTRQLAIALLMFAAGAACFVAVLVDVVTPLIGFVIGATAIVGLLLTGIALMIVYIDIPE